MEIAPEKSPSMTADAIDQLEREIDGLIDRYLVAIERRLRADVAATGPEDDDALDRPPDPGSPWTRITIEEEFED